MSTKFTHLAGINHLFIHAMNKLPKRDDSAQHTVEISAMTEESHKLKEAAYLMVHTIKSNHPKVER